MLTRIIAEAVLMLSVYPCVYACVLDIISTLRVILIKLRVCDVIQEYFTLLI